jgi:hypothetical protein
MTHSFFCSFHFLLSFLLTLFILTFTFYIFSIDISFPFLLQWLLPSPDIYFFTNFPNFNIIFGIFYKFFYHVFHCFFISCLSGSFRSHSKKLFFSYSRFLPYFFSLYNYTFLDLLLIQWLLPMPLKQVFCFLIFSIFSDI